MPDFTQIFTMEVLAMNNIRRQELRRIAATMKSLSADLAAVLLIQVCLGPPPPPRGRGGLGARSGTTGLVKGGPVLMRKKKKRRKA